MVSAGLRQFKLIQFAQRFAQAGYAVVLFDYRYWGGSTGRPRELVSIKKQLEDWRTMINHLKERKSIDNRRIVLWGTALSGGYVLDIAAEFKNVQAVMAQVPFVDGAASAKLYPLQQFPKALKLSSQDYMGGKWECPRLLYLWLIHESYVFCRRKMPIWGIVRLLILIIIGVVRYLPDSFLI